MSNDWDALDNETRHGYWYAIKWAIAIIIAAVLISAVLWAFVVGGSDVKGRGDAVRTKNAAGNRIAAQEGFQADYNTIKSADANLAVAWAAWGGDKTDVIGKTNYYGAIRYCTDLVGAYNARAQKFTQQQFRDASLPRHIALHGQDGADQLTDCYTQETVK